MPQPDFAKLVSGQREFFLSGATRPGGLAQGPARGG